MRRRPNVASRKFGGTDDSRYATSVASSLSLVATPDAIAVVVIAWRAHSIDSLCLLLRRLVGKRRQARSQLTEQVADGDGNPTRKRDRTPVQQLVPKQRHRRDTV